MNSLRLCNVLSLKSYFMAMAGFNRYKKPMSVIILNFLIHIIGILSFMIPLAYWAQRFLKIPYPNV